MLIIFISTYAYSEIIQIAGKVVDKATKQGIGNVMVVVYPSGKKVYTKPNGNFLLTDIEKTDVTYVQFMKDGYEITKVNENLSEIYLELNLTTKVEGQRIIVTAKKDEKKVVVSKQTVDKQNIEHATTNIFGDSIKVIQTLPGVVTTNQISALMYIRGGDSYEVMYYYDRILLLNPYIFGGLISVYNPDVVRDIDFYSGGFPAEYGNAMSGIIDARMKDGRTDKYSGFFDISITTFTALIEGPIGEKNNTEDSFLIAVRRTYYDLAVQLIADLGIIDKSFRGIQLPYFYDAHIRFKLKLNDYNMLRIFSMILYEGLDITYEQTKSVTSASSGWQSGNEVHYANLRILQGVSLTSALSDNVILENTLGYTLTDGKFQYIDNENPAQLKNTSHYFSYRGDLTIKSFKHHIVKTGFGVYSVLNNMNMDFIMKSIPSGFSGLSPTQPIPIQDSDVPVRQFHENYTSRLYLFPDVYVQDDIEVIADFFFINLGLRSEYFNITNNFTLDPRASMKFVFKNLFTLKLAIGQYSQSIENLRVYDYKYGNPNMNPEKAYHGVVGVEKDLEDFYLRGEAFYKLYVDLVTQDYQTNYRNGEIGRSYGFDLFIQKKISGKWDGWLSYTFVITERKITDRISVEEYNASVPPQQQRGAYPLPAGEWYFPEFDRRHSINLIVNYAFTEKWKISTTTKAGSGLPYTPLAGVNTYSIRTDVNDPSTETGKAYSPVWGEYNSKRLPWFCNVDVKFSMPFFWKNWSSYIQLSNLLSLFHIEMIQGYHYNSDYTERTATTGLPFLIIAGIRAEF